MSVRISPWFGVPPGLIKSGLYLKLSASDKDLCLYLYWKSDRCSSRSFEAKDSEIIVFMGISHRSLCDARKHLSALGVALCERTLGGLYTYTLCDLSTGKPYPGDPNLPISWSKVDEQKQRSMMPTPNNWFHEERLDGATAQVTQASSRAKSPGSRTATGDEDRLTLVSSTTVDEPDTNFNFGFNVAKEQPKPSIQDFNPFESGRKRSGRR
jgi:hypothetical protein